MTLKGPPESQGKESAAKAGDAGSSLGREAPGGGPGSPLQYSCLEKPVEPGGPQSMGSQGAGHSLATERQSVRVQSCAQSHSRAAPGFQQATGPGQSEATGD